MRSAQNPKTREQQKPGVPDVLGIVSFRIFPTLMGGQKGVAFFYAALRHHLDVTLAVSDDNENKSSPEAHPVLYPNRKIYLNLFRLKELQKLMKENGTDVIIAEHSYTGWLAWLLRKRTGRPFIIHSHNIESKRFRQMHKWWWRFYEMYEGWIHRKADHNFFISKEDEAYAREKFGVKQERSTVITYGVLPPGVPTGKKELRIKLGLDPEQTIFLFNGTLDYKPNYDAVMALIEKIDPLLSKSRNHYRIVITGNRAPQALLDKMSASENIHYAGYVDDVNEWYQAADLFLNPVLNDTGVKTKLIESVANHCTALSTRSGASGINVEACGSKLVVTDDHDWEKFVNLVPLTLQRSGEKTPEAFYSYYSWESLARKAADKIQSLHRA